MKNNKVIIALYKAVAEVKEIVAWDFPARQYKKSVNAIMDILAKNDIPSEKTVAEWPHFTLAYVPPLKEEQKQKIKLLAPLYNTRVVTTNLISLMGEKFPKIYIAWGLKFDNEKGVRSLIQDINEITNTTQKFEFKPHISLVMIDKQYEEQLNAIWDQVEEAAKKHKIAYKPEQLQIWANMDIDDIESLELK